MRVGVFDSGIGGLNVLAACMKLLPQCTFFYYGDNAHAPYGSRPEKDIFRFVGRAMKAFERVNADAVVLACNTATAVCAERIRAAVPFPVVGMEPAVRPAAAVCRNVLVLATPHTISSIRLHRLVSNSPQSHFRLYAVPSLASAIERHFQCGTPLTLSDHLPDYTPDGVVLGCTHYVYFRSQISEYYHCPVFDGVQGTAERLAEVLLRQVMREPIGMSDHFFSPQKANNCLTKKCNEWAKEKVFFLGEGKNINQKIFFQTFVLL